MQLKSHWSVFKIKLFKILKIYDKNNTESLALNFSNNGQEDMGTVWELTQLKSLTFRKLAMVLRWLAHMPFRESFTPSPVWTRT